LEKVSLIVRHIEAFQQLDVFFVEALASNSKNDMDVNLRVGVSNDMPVYGAYRNLNTGNYKDFAPTEHVIVRAILLGTPIDG
jgi:hypothetical protein